MVDAYHLFKLCTTTARILKASKGTYNTVMIFKGVWKPLAIMGVSGVVDGACEDIADKAIKMIVKETE